MFSPALASTVVISACPEHSSVQISDRDSYLPPPPWGPGGQRGPRGRTIWGVSVSEQSETTFSLKLYRNIQCNVTWRREGDLRHDLTPPFIFNNIGLLFVIKIKGALSIVQILNILNGSDMINYFGHFQRWNKENRLSLLIWKDFNIHNAPQGCLKIKDTILI